MLESILHIILTILSVLGICLLSILCILVLVIILVLFVPIRYEITFTGEKKQIELFIRLHWLLHFIRAVLKYKNILTCKIHLLFFKIYDSEAVKKPDSSKNIKRKDNSETTDHSSYSDDLSDETDTDSKIDSSKQQAFDKPEDEIKESSNQQKHVECKDINEQSSSLNHFKKIIDTLKYYYSLLKDENNIKLLNECKLRIWKVLKSILPKKCDVRLVFGTGSPDTTGQLLGIWAMMYPFIGNKSSVEADFEHKRFEGTGYLKGKIFIYTVLYQFIRLYFNDALRQFIRKIKREEE